MSHPHLAIEWISGFCPVQAEGTIGGNPFYFRARGTCWSLSVASSPNSGVWAEDAWLYREYVDQWPNAGWMDHGVAEEKIREAAKRWHQETACHSGKEPRETEEG